MSILANMVTTIDLGQFRKPFKGNEINLEINLEDKE